MDKKVSKEVTVLGAFLKACPCFADGSSKVTPHIPPQPDCCCDFSDGRQIFFELSEVIEQSMAQKFNDPKLSFAGGFFCDEILTDRIKEKLTKKYQTNGREVELLLYFDLQSTWPEATMIDQVKGVIDSMGKGPFDRIWLFSVPKEKVIAKF